VTHNLVKITQNLVTQKLCLTKTTRFCVIFQTSPCGPPYIYSYFILKGNIIFHLAKIQLIWCPTY